MPTLDFSRYESSPTWETGFSVLALMLSPHDRDQQRLFYDTLFIAKQLSQIADVSSSSTWSLLERQHRATATRVYKHIQVAWQRGSLAGDLFLILRSLAVHTQKGSITQALHALVHALSVDATTYGGMQDAYTNAVTIS